MQLKIAVTCPKGHGITATLGNLPDINSLNVGGKILVPGQCPTCGTQPLSARSGYYELQKGHLKRLGDYRPEK